MLNHCTYLILLFPGLAELLEATTSNMQIKTKNMVFIRVSRKQKSLQPTHRFVLN